MIMLAIFSVLGFYHVCDVPVDNWNIMDEVNRNLLVQAVLERYCDDTNCRELDYMLVQDGDKIQIFARCKKWRI